MYHEEPYTTRETIGSFCIVMAVVCLFITGIISGWNALDALFPAPQAKESYLQSQTFHANQGGLDELMGTITRVCSEGQDTFYAPCLISQTELLDGSIRVTWIAVKEDS